MEIKLKKQTKERVVSAVLLILSFIVLSYIVPLFRITVLNQFFPFIYMVFCCWYILKYTMPEYTYKFGEELFIIEKESSYKTITFLNVEYENIISVDQNKKGAKNLTAGVFDKNYLVVTYREKGKEKKAKIHKSDELISCFKEKIGDRFYE